MAIREGSRNQLTSVIVPISAASGLATRPAFVDLRQRVTATAQDDRVILVVGADGWSQIGARYLGDARAYWVMADLSGVVDPFTELGPNTRLRVPSIARFQMDILSGERP